MNTSGSTGRNSRAVTAYFNWLDVVFNVRLNDGLTFSGMNVDLYGGVSARVKDLRAGLTSDQSRKKIVFHLTSVYFCDGHE